MIQVPGIIGVYLYDLHPKYYTQKPKKKKENIPFKVVFLFYFDIL